MSTLRSVQIGEEQSSRKIPDEEGTEIISRGRRAWTVLSAAAERSPMRRGLKFSTKQTVRAPRIAQQKDPR